MRYAAYTRSLSRVVRYKLCKPRRLGWIALALMLILVLIFANLPVHYVFTNENINEPCTLPKIDPFDKTIMQFVTKLDPLNCGVKLPLFYVDKEGILYLNTTALQGIGETDTSVQCTYAGIIRHNGDYDVSLSKVMKYAGPVLLDHDFVRVTCVNGDSARVYDETITNVAAHVTQEHTEIADESEEDVSVLLFGLDSTSRNAAVRFLPRTFAYMTEALNAYDFKGSMKLGDNTMPNVIPMLTGKTAFTNELPFTDYTTNSFDRFPFIWKKFSERKYVTLLAEDMPKRNIFNTDVLGFKRQPTDHYMRPFWLATFSGIVTDTLSKLYRFLGSKSLKVGHEKVFCTGTTPSHQLVINYVKQTMDAYKGKRKFGMSYLNEIGHEYQTYLQYADDDFLDFFKWMNTSGHLTNTVVVFFSDHGSRYDFVRNTYVGRVESRMPLLIIHIPDHLKSKYPNIHTSLDMNTNRLVTFYDIYQTLVDILNKNYETPSEQYVAKQRRGISLFRPVPDDRSCADALIPSDFCACFDSIPINIENNELVKEIAEQIVAHMNLQLSSHKSCASLNVFQVKSVRKVQQGLKYVKTVNKGISLFQFSRPEEKHFGQYTVTLETVPGHGVFDVSVSYDTAAGIQVIGDIERTNKFGNQSACITIKHLKQTCYCIS